MSSTPERDAPGQWGGGTQQSARPGAPSQGTMPGQEQFGTVPGQPQGGYGQPQGGMPGQHWGSQPGGASPVDRDETRVVGRRVVQYIIDYVLVGIIPGLAYWLLDRGSLHWIGWTVATLISIVVYLWYWVLRPYGHDGQTFGMQLLGLRVISKHGGPASTTQLFVRGILLIIDMLVFGLVGLITMSASRYHQRVGDHAARTLVISAGYGARGRSQFAGTDARQTGMGQSGMGQSGMGQSGMDQSGMDQSGMGQSGMDPGSDQAGTEHGMPGDAR
jgi:uncharacterized RDD family membrane protein YckC